jgi:hypothetical protein
VVVHWRPPKTFQGQEMTRLFTAFGLLLMLAGCATLPHLSASDADRVKNGKSVVLFVDNAQQISYLQDKYYVLAVTQEGSTSVYKGIWDSGKDLSALHAAEFAKLGLRARSAYEIFSEQDLERLTQEDNDGSVQPKQPGPSEAMAPQLRQALLDKGQDYLIWATWGGYTLHIQTLGLPPNEQFVLVYRIFDVKNNKLLAGGQSMYLHKVDLEGQTGKDFLEKDNLAGFRSQVEKHIRERFTDPPKASIGKILGLQG